jgi:outer membrane protein assembly factor BamB
MNLDTIFVGASDGRVYAVRKSTGAILWTKQVDSRIASQLTLIGSRLYVGSEFGNVYALDQQTGTLSWHYQTRGAIRGRIAVSNGVVYFGSADGYVYAVSEDRGRKRWRTRTGASVQTVLSVREGLLATSFDNFVYFLSLTNGNRLWKRQLAGRLAAEPLATFDGVLFTSLSADSGIVLNLKDGKQLNSLPLGDESSTAASPIIAGNVLMVITRHGVLAFTRPKGE